LLRDLLDSLAPHQDALKFDIACLDLGLAETTRAEVAARVRHVVAPTWSFRPHARFDADRRHLSRAARPFLPDLLPGYTIYAWLDADVWVQHALGPRWLIEAAARADVAAVPVVHRAYTFRPQDMAWLFERYRMALGEGLARELTALPYVNAGVLAVRAGSPLWRAYAERFQAALDRWDGAFLSDQAVVNATIYLESLRVQRLPARANWICHLALPAWNPQTRELVEPALPFDPLLIVHNTFDDKSFTFDLPSLKGQPRRTRLTRSAINSLRHSQVV
jgi:lipopolysaccharide biosynthesis glycosyltransferase